MNAYTLAMRNYLTVDGRMSRRDFWTFTLIIIAMLFAALVVESITFGSALADIGLLTLLVGCVHLLPFITASVRRLHDADLSGWLYLVNAVPLGQIVFFFLVCLPPTPGANKFGSPPDSDDAGPAPAANPYAVFKSQEPPITTFASVHAEPRLASGRSRPASPPAAALNIGDQTLAQIEKLAALRSQGVIDDTEFANLKSKLLASS